MISRSPWWCWYSLAITSALIAYGIGCVTIVRDLARDYPEAFHR